MTSRLGLVLSLLVASAALAQIPLGKEFQVNAPEGIHQGPGSLGDLNECPAVLDAPDGTEWLTWLARLPPQDGDQFSRLGIVAQRFDARGRRLGEPFIVHDSDGRTPGPFGLAGSPDGHTLFAWLESGAGLLVRRYDAEGQPEGTPFRVQEPSSGSEGLPALAALGDRGFAVVWETVDALVDPFTANILGLRLGPEGQPAGAELEVAENFGSETLRLNLAADASGNILVVWSRGLGDGSGYAVFGQFLAANGEKLGAPLQLNTHRNKDQLLPAVAALGGGEFVAVWQSAGQDGSSDGIYGQRLSTLLGRVGPEFRVNTTTFSAQRWPDVASDKKGNFAVVWTSFGTPIGFGWTIRGQLYHRDGRPVGSELALSQMPRESLLEFRPKVALGPRGTLTAVWEALADNGENIYARRFAASPGDEVCALAEGQMLCDLGRTGGEAEVTLKVALAPSEVPLLADVDGDGRADVCVRRGRRFLCKTRLDEGGGLEPFARFGSGGGSETPLLGDFDGDGRADPCLYEGPEFRCDAGRGGGSRAWRETLGERGDLPLLGDLDGDGRADPCVYERGVFLCDTRHAGQPDVRIAFGVPGDLPLLGDFDGDGRVDPCVQRGGRLLCDVRHDGTAGGELLFGGPGQRLVMGNLDGL